MLIYVSCAYEQTIEYQFDLITLWWVVINKQMFNSDNTWLWFSTLRKKFFYKRYVYDATIYHKTRVD